MGNKIYAGAISRLRPLLIFLLGVFCSTLLFTDVFAQQKYTVSGYVKEAKSGENMLAVNVYIKELTKGTITNEYGFYSLTVPQGNYTLVASFLGYQTVEKPIVLNQDVRMNMELGFSEIMADEVVITGERKDQNIESTDMGKVELTTEEVKAIPALMGETDILKTLQLLPGVQSAGEGNSGFYVRGGGPDQNLILLDDAVVYNTGHLFGFFSVFNSDAIKNTTLIKGGMPAEYGGRLSSVVDVGMKEGNLKEWEVDGGIGLIASRLTIQGPIKKDKASFIVSGRRTYLDVFIPLFDKGEGEFSGTSYYFYDLNAKVNYIFSDKDRLYLSGYFGRDVFKFGSPDGAFSIDIPWGNATSTLRWNHLFNDKLFMNMMAIYNDYNFEIRSGFQDVSFSLFSGVRDLSGKVDFDYFPSVNHKVKFGGQYTHHTFTPYNASGNAGDTEFETDSLNRKYAHEASVYILDDFTLTDRIKVNVGLRGSVFSQIGPLQKVTFNEVTGAPEDTLSYGKGENVATYWGLEPRISGRFKINKVSSIKAGITFTNQYIHLVSSSSSTLPTDLWVPSTAVVAPQFGIQYSAGYFRNLKEDMYETSVEVYYKDLRNQIEYGESYVQEINTDIEDSFVFGKGWSYGAEFFVKKARGKLNGWIGYTLSFTNRQFDDVNKGEPFPAKYDRRHDLSVVGIYEINERWRLGSTFVYGTGQATTVPIGRYFIDGQVVNQYGGRNEYRLVPYHRLDFSATLKLKTKFYSDLTFAIYNVYNRKNPYFIYYEVNGDIAGNNLAVQAKQVSLFPILPSITWNFRF